MPWSLVPSDEVEEATQLLASLQLSLGRLDQVLQSVCTGCYSLAATCEPLASVAAKLRSQSVRALSVACA